MYTDSDEEATRLMGICNSSLVRLLLEAKSPTMSFVAEDVGSLPVLVDDGSAKLLSTIEELQDNAKEDWDDSESSWGFVSNSLVANGKAKSLAESFEEYSEYWRGITLRQRELEELNNELVAELYDLSHEVQPGVPLEDVTLVRNPAFRYSAKAMEQQKKTCWMWWRKH